jgi:hypothetical protein
MNRLNIFIFGLLFLLIFNWVRGNILLDKKIKELKEKYTCNLIKNTKKKHN